MLLIINRNASRYHVAHLHGLQSLQQPCGEDVDHFEDDKTESQRSNLPKVVELLSDTKLPLQHRERPQSYAAADSHGKQQAGARSFQNGGERSQQESHSVEWKGVWVGSESPGLDLPT